MAESGGGDEVKGRSCGLHGGEKENRDDWLFFFYPKAHGFALWFSSAKEGNGLIMGLREVAAMH